METYRGYVMADELDSNNHMNVQFYTKKFDMASGQLLAILGFSFQNKMREDIGFAYVESTIKYIKEVFEDSPIHITSEIIDIGNKVVSIKHSMWHSVDKTLHSECVMKWLFFDQKIRKSIPVPSDLVTVLEAHMKS